MREAELNVMQGCALRGRTISRKIFKAGQSRPARRVLKLYKAQMGRRPNVPLSLSQSTDFRPLKDFRQGQAPNAPEGVRAHDALRRRILASAVVE